MSIFATAWSDAFLDEMRQTQDPLADAVVKQLFDSDGIGAVNALMQHLVQNDQPVPDQLPPVVQAYLQQVNSLPPWADLNQIRLAEEVFGRSGFAIPMVLICASLPWCYAGKKGVQVLAMTGRLQSDTKRRIGETAQMIIDTLAEGGLEPDGKGMRDLQKIRLMHAAIRHLVEASGHWDPAWDKPINQEDMVGTLMSFSHIVIQGLEKLNMPLSPDEAEAYLHTQKVVGYVLGVREAIMPDTVADAAVLVDAIARRQFAPCPQGQAMAAALVEFMEDITPGTIFKGFPPTLIRHLAGDSVADMLALHQSDWTAILEGPLAEVFDVVVSEEERSRMLEKIAATFSRQLIQGLVWNWRGGNRPIFTIPDNLRQQWGISGTPQDLILARAGG